MVQAEEARRRHARPTRHRRPRTSTNAPSRAPRRRLRTALLLALGILSATLVGALPASAITSTGLGTGHRWNGDRAS
ncbi:hypothetical protein ASF17_12005 [Frigoribacterium sp. Leaf263]|uniref:hypothetical protein n=1 Tax=Frigoribacterium sp. Leaf263 TaxID=1736313 RepID=UPI0007007711|nr:hypothetical protein [Frigoribacterium sp. Leaf263]KQO81824.1 hypothetical protein ASF17_12005 [Frigoribacterium sp. Leaf263]